MLRLIILINLILAPFLISPTYAVTIEGHSTSNSVSVHNSAATVAEKQTEIKSTPNPSPVLKTENSNFEAKGKITSLSGDSFDVEGITITKNPKYLVSISGNIEVGKNVEVKGILENGLRYAVEIKIEGSINPSPSPTPKPSQNNSNPNNPAPQSKPTESPIPAVLSETKSNPASSKPHETFKPNLVIGNQNIPLPSLSSTPQPSTTPKPRTNFFNPVITFF